MGEPKPNIDSISVLLQTLGADVADATRIAAMWVKEEQRPPTFLEVYGQGSIVDAAQQSRRDLGVKGIGAFDLRTCKPCGAPWDFSKRSDKALARECLLLEKPTWIIGSPPCTVFSTWQGLTFSKMSPKEVATRIRAGKIQL